MFFRKTQISERASFHPEGLRLRSLQSSPRRATDRSFPAVPTDSEHASCKSGKQHTCRFDSSSPLLLILLFRVAFTAFVVSSFSGASRSRAEALLLLFSLLVSSAVLVPTFCLTRCQFHLISNDFGAALVDAVRLPDAAEHARTVTFLTQMFECQNCVALRISARQWTSCKTCLVALRGERVHVCS